MRTMTGILALAATAAAAWTAPAGAAEDDRLRGPVSLQADDIEWKPAPPVLPEGARIAVLEGDLAQAEPHTFRLKLPDGYRVPPHSHPMREHITVLSGLLRIGKGETFDRNTAEPLTPGAFYALPVGMHHYVWAEGETVLQLHGTGPWGIEYVRAADDPRKGGGR